ncbi:unnamed protein product [Rhizophagus irregularis]|nr:unnamed protein product [Rhizophagus irregularis]
MLPASIIKICFGIDFAREVQSWESTTDAACKYYREFNEINEMGENQNRNQSNKENKGKMSGPLLFGLKLLSVERVRRTMSLDFIKFDHLMILAILKNVAKYLDYHSVF